MSVSNVRPLHADPDWRATEAAYCDVRVGWLDAVLDSLAELADAFADDDAMQHAARALGACCRSQVASLEERSLQLRVAIREREAEARTWGR